MMRDDVFEPVSPWPQPKREDCMFYHSVTLTNGEQIDGAWDRHGLSP